MDLLELSESEDAILKVDFCQFHNVHNCYRVETFTGVQTKTGLLGGCSVLHHHDELRVSIVAWYSYGIVCFPSTVILIIKLVQLRVDFKLICKSS